MKIHILGICGTFMGGVAVLAKQLGHTVSGSDGKVYPPMSTQLEEQGISLYQGFGEEQLDDKPDLVIVGNVMKRGMPVVERLLNEDIPFMSGPAWIAAFVLKGRHTLAVSGTHGKTTTTSMLTWILEFAGLKPGFLVGGVPENFGVSARLGAGETFVIEADEYDSAFFDKRSKFIHYAPRTLIANNLEFDHADIFDDLAAIQKQFHYLVRTVPGEGLIVAPRNDANLQAVFEMGVWTPIEHTDVDWTTRLMNEEGSEFEVFYQTKSVGTLKWNLLGEHNIANALSAMAAAHHVGVSPQKSLEALSQFKNVKRRLECTSAAKGIQVYDDFAHHPTAIRMTLAGLRARAGQERIIAVAELGSYTMRSGAHKETLIPAFEKADQVFLYIPDDASKDVLNLESKPAHVQVMSQVEDLLQAVLPTLQAQDHVLIMSNRGFEGFKGKLLAGI